MRRFLMYGSMCGFPNVNNAFIYLHSLGGVCGDRGCGGKPAVK